MAGRTRCPSPRRCRATPDFPAAPEPGRSQPIVSRETSTGKPPKQKCGRKHLPIGREFQGTVLRGPPVWPPGKAWPPSVSAARKALSGSMAGRSTCLRSAVAYFTYAGALAYRAVEEGGREDDLIEAFSIFDKIAASNNVHHFGKYRASALFNATECMKALPARRARGLSATLLLRAVEAIGDSLLEGVRATMNGSREGLLSGFHGERLDWRGEGTLVPATKTGVLRVRSLSESVEASWSGVRASLANHGLTAPERCLVDSPVVVASPRKGVILVTAA